MHNKGFKKKLIKFHKFSRNLGQITF